MKTIKTLLTLSLLVLFLADTHAQLDAYKMGILPFQYTSGRYEQEAAAQFENLVVEVFVNSQRVTIIDRSFYEELKDKEWMQSTQEVDESALEKTAAEGAKFIIMGKVNSTSVDRNREGRYNCIVNARISVVDVETAEVVKVKTMNNRNISNGLLNGVFGARTQSESITKAVNKLRDEVTVLLNEIAPLQTKVIRMEKTKGNKAVELLLGFGSDVGVKTKQTYLIAENEVIDLGGGKTQSYKNTFGEIVIIDVMTATLSKARVKRGQEEVFKKMKQGVELFIVPKKEASKF